MKRLIEKERERGRAPESHTRCDVPSFSSSVASSSRTAPPDPRLLPLVLDDSRITCLVSPTRARLHSLADEEEEEPPRDESLPLMCGKIQIEAPTAEENHSDAEASGRGTTSGWEIQSIAASSCQLDAAMEGK